MSKPHLYINSKGYEVTRHSYSGSESFHFCAKKYELERVQGWQEKVIRSSTQFGICLEKAITCWHQRGQDWGTAVAEFVRLWAEHKDKPYTYTKSDLDWNRLNLTGQELVRLYAIKYPTFPYTVPNPASAFQVETSVEVFPGSKLQGIEFTSYIDLIAQIEDDPDSLWHDYTKGYDKQAIIIDIKTSGKDVPEYTVLDPQLRSYAWVKGYPNVAFLWFKKCGRTISKGDTVTVLEPYGGMTAGTEAVVLSQDDLGGFWLAKDQTTVDESNARFRGSSKAVVAEKQAFIESHAVSVPERAFTKQQVQFKAAVITPESARDIGQAIKRDIIAIADATEKDFFPMQSGVRFPNDKCTTCPMRGICANIPKLRDELLTRKQMDEFEFSE